MSRGLSNMGIPRSPSPAPHLSLLSVTPLTVKYTCASIICCSGVKHCLLAPGCKDTEVSALFYSQLLAPCHFTPLWQYNFSVVEIYDFTFLLVLATLVMFYNSFLSWLQFVLAHRNSIPKALHAETCLLVASHSWQFSWISSILLSFPEAVTLLSSVVNCFVKKFGGRLIFFSL